MTARTRSKSTMCTDKDDEKETSSLSEETPLFFVSSATEEEAKTRFREAVSDGINFFTHRGLGRDRAARELVNMIADGCSPNEDEIFKVMETRGLSFDDSTKVITVATAFNTARDVGGVSTTEAIDQLTSRLNFSLRTIHSGISDIRTPSPTSCSSASLPSSPNKHSVHITRNDSACSVSPTASTKKNRTKGKSDKAGRTTIQKGKRRALADKGTTTQARTEDCNKSSADTEVKEKKMLQAKLKDGKRAKSPEAKPRAKRTCVQRLEESQPKKRARATPDNASCSL